MTKPRRPPEFTVFQVADMCGVSPITVYVWISRGHVRKTPRGKVDGASVIRYLITRGLRGQHAHRRAALDALLRDLQDSGEGEVRSDG